MKSRRSLIFFFLLVSSIAAQDCPKACLHDGIADAKTCSCQCLAAWEGVYCERVKDNCNAAQPAECGSSLTTAFCVFDKIRSYCPKMCSHPACRCGIDQCLNGGFFDSATCTCNCPRNFYGKVCENFSTCSQILTCENFGTFNATSCRCDCLTPNFSGNRCEQFTCNVTDPLYCSIHSKQSCSQNNFVFGICPQLCERCLTTLTTTTITTTTTTTTALLNTTNLTTLPTQTSVLTFQTTTTSVQVISEIPTTTETTSTGLTTTVVTSCSPLACENGFVFNTATCSCQCGFGFSGVFCEQFDCATSPVPDNAQVCPLIPCDGSAVVNGNCPFKCLCGAATNGAFTASLPQTTSVVTSCVPLACENGFVFSTNTCACPCSNGFSGARCEQFNCAISPMPDTLVPQCSILPCNVVGVNGVCPFKCLCGQAGQS